MRSMQMQASDVSARVAIVTIPRVITKTVASGVLDSAKLLEVFRGDLKKCTLGGWSPPDVMQIFLDALRSENQNLHSL